MDRSTTLFGRDTHGISGEHGMGRGNREKVGKDESLAYSQENGGIYPPEIFHIDTTNGHI